MLTLALSAGAASAAPAAPAKPVRPPTAAPTPAPTPALVAASLLDSKPADLRRIPARGAGELVRIFVKVGDPVTEKQLLGNLDEERELIAAEAARTRADDTSAVELALAEATLRGAALEEAEAAHRRRRVERPFVDKVRAELGMATAKLKLAQTNRKLAELEARRAESELERRRFRSPIAGVVYSVEKAVGDKVALDTVVFTVGSGEVTELEGRLPAALAQLLQENGGLLVRLKGESDQRVARLVRIGAIDPATKLFPVTLAVDTPPAPPDPARPIQYEIAEPTPAAPSASAVTPTAPAPADPRR